MRPGFGARVGSAFFVRRFWVDERGAVVRYNLAFLLPHRSGLDHGRILGFDNAHGMHERHSMGEVKPVVFRGYLDTAERFFREVELLRKRYEE